MHPFVCINVRLIANRIYHRASIKYDHHFAVVNKLNEYVQQNSICLCFDVSIDRDNSARIHCNRHLLVDNISHSFAFVRTRCRICSIRIHRNHSLYYTLSHIQYISFHRECKHIDALSVRRSQSCIHVEFSCTCILMKRVDFDVKNLIYLIFDSSNKKTSSTRSK